MGLINPGYVALTRLAEVAVLATGGWILFASPVRRWRHAAFLLLLPAPLLALLLPWGTLGAWLPPPSPQLGYFTGRLSLLNMAAPTSDPRVPGQLRLCLELARALPDGSTVVNLNYYGGMGWCVYSDDLPRGKIQHQYQSDFTRHFGPLVLGRPEDARALYQKLKIDYFFVEKGAGDFWGAGSSELFSERNLPRYFDVAVEAEYFYLLTWRGRGRAPVTPALARRIDSWRDDPRFSPPAASRAEAFQRYRAWAAAR